jgi:hypothetical protein
LALIEVDAAPNQQRARCGSNIIALIHKSLDMAKRPKKRTHLPRYPQIPKYSRLKRIAVEEYKRSRESSITLGIGDREYLDLAVFSNDEGSHSCSRAALLNTLAVLE